MAKLLRDFLRDENRKIEKSRFGEVKFDFFFVFENYTQKKTVLSPMLGEW